MLSKLILVCVWAVMFAVTPAMATVLTFDDLNTGGASEISPDTYPGLSFNYWWHIDSPPFDYPYASFPTVIYNSQSPHTDTATIFAESSIDVLSVYLADYYYTSRTVTLLGYSGSSLLYSLTVEPLVESMTKYTLNFNGIDKFVMQTDNGYAFLDNFEYVPAARPVPEPASLALIGVCLAGLVVSRRCQQA